MKLFDYVLEGLVERLEKEGFEILIEATNVKMYNLSSYTFKNFEEKEGIDIFNRICEGEYSFFIDELREKGCETSYIGRTSSFYVIPEYNAGEFVQGVINAYEQSYNKGNSFIEKMAFEILDYEGIREEDTNREIVESVELYVGDNGQEKLREKIDRFFDVATESWFDYLNVKGVKEIHEYIKKVKECDCKELVEYYIC